MSQLDRNYGVTRTWIRRSTFSQRPIFQAWGSLTSLKSQTRDPPLKVSSGGLVLRIFMSKKIHRPWISRRARYLETTETDTLNIYINPGSLVSRFKAYCFELALRDGALVRSPVVRSPEWEESLASVWDWCIVGNLGSYWFVEVIIESQQRG